MYMLIFLLIGMFIGWNMPQPAWAKTIQDKFSSIFSNLTK